VWAQGASVIRRRPPAAVWRPAWAAQTLSTMTTEQHEVDPGDRFAGARRFPSHLDSPSTGGGAELGELVQLYEPAGSWLAPADAPAAVPPVVASGPGSRVGWLLCGRRGGDTG